MAGALVSRVINRSLARRKEGQGPRTVAEIQCNSSKFALKDPLYVHLLQASIYFLIYIVKMLPGESTATSLGEVSALVAGPSKGQMAGKPAVTTK